MRVREDRQVCGRITRLINVELGDGLMGCTDLLLVTVCMSG